MSPHHAVVAALASLALLALSGCTKEPQPPSAKTEVTVGDLHIGYRLPQGEIPLNKPFSVVIAIETDRGPLAATTPVVVDARMPAHNHGMPVQPEVVPIEPGLWQADPMLFPMAGHWQMTVTVGHEPATTHAMFDIELLP